MKRLLSGSAALGAAIVLALASPSSAAQPVPAPKVDLPRAGGLQTAVLAGGCFWGMEGVFEHVKGVKDVTSGYTGGSRADASYERVSTETTGHAESVKIVYDPKQVSYGELLRIYFSVAHDPTELNRQGPDTGTSYRSAIFAQNADQKKVAAAYIAQLQAAHVFNRPIVTRIEAGIFYPAEAEHQDFMRRNPSYPYIVINDAPKVRALKQVFPTEYTG